MSLRRVLDDVFNKGRSKLNEHTGQPPSSSPSYRNEPTPPVPSWSKPPQGQQPNSAPPIPTSTHPSHPTSQPQSQPQPYWHPAFDPSLPVSTHFIQETGAHGWGNNESQNYTTSRTNSFFTPRNELVLRAIVSTSSASDKHTSARLITHQKLSRNSGYLAATLRAPCAIGIWPAFWLLPAAPFHWPSDGEVDIFESWNGDCVNHSCLHWGHFNGEDWNKHRVVETHVPSMPEREVQIGFAWMQAEGINEAAGQMIWYLNGRAVMRADIPPGIRRLSDWRIIINIAMGGNVCGGKLPTDGSYDFVVTGLSMWDTPIGGWEQFERDWKSAKNGKTM